MSVIIYDPDPSSLDTWAFTSMAAASLPTDVDSLETWEFNSRPSSTILDTTDLYWPYPVPGGVTSEYVNKCVDGVTGQWVYWKTAYQDFNGIEYPGDSFNSGTYKVQSITFGA